MTEIYIMIRIPKISLKQKLLLIFKTKKTAINNSNQQQLVSPWKKDKNKRVLKIENKNKYNIQVLKKIKNNNVYIL